MNFKGVGAIFCLIASILAGVRFIAAAIYASSAATISAEIFGVAMTSVGPALLIARYRGAGCRRMLPVPGIR